MRNILVIFALACFATKAANSEKTLACYVRGTMPFREIEAYLCTHIYFEIYAPKPNGMLSHLAYESINKTSGYGYLREYNQENMLKLKQNNPGVKFFASIGGENTTAAFSSIANNESFLNTFMVTTQELVEIIRYDGINLNWDNLPTANNNDFLKILNRLKELHKMQIQISAVVSGSPLVNQRAYNKPQICMEVDIVNLKVFGLAGDGATAINAPYSAISDMVSSYLLVGCRPNQILIGVTSLPVTYCIQNQSDNSIGTPATIEDMHLTVDLRSYFCNLVKSPNWITKQADFTPYSYGPGERSASRWLTYEDEASVMKKAQLASQKGLGGMFIYDYDRDDSVNFCQRGTFPLTKAAIRGLTTPIETTTPAPKPNTPAPFRCTSLGFFAHPTDCTKFYRCGILIRQLELQCPPNYGWNQPSKMCSLKQYIPGCY